MFVKKKTFLSEAEVDFLYLVLDRKTKQLIIFITQYGVFLLKLVVDQLIKN